MSLLESLGFNTNKAIYVWKKKKKLYWKGLNDWTFFLSFFFSEHFLAWNQFFMQF